MPAPDLYFALSGLIAVTVCALVGLRGWQGWLALKSRELELIGGGSPVDPQPYTAAASRIELADLKERIRKLEAIAAGVDL
ncbi:hypothetical protein GTZ99_02835 [Novosphingobium sp. FSY-8]|uniref:Phage shock protein B n=1 Tax=Novosphingobium ovatum TaxID=1908523 RepID=A0ABW9XAD0_9SPHN|nr:hypothetical protein [Novosphingobium ovatum]NBC35487.1 hypothetical protein [Novosphingobium ovatum]